MPQPNYCLLLKKAKALSLFICEKSFGFVSLGSHRPLGLLIFVLYQEKQCWHVQFLLSLMIFETNCAWASSLGAAFCGCSCAASE